MDTTIKVTSIHVVLAIITSALSAGLSLGWFGIKNDVFAGLLALIILYLTGQLCQRLYGDEIKGFTTWLWDGIAPFIFTWFVVYTLFFNYLGTF